MDKPPPVADLPPPLCLGARPSIASLSPFGLGLPRRHPLLEAFSALWTTRADPGRALDILRHGACGLCDLGASGLSDVAHTGVHICPIRMRQLPDALRPPRPVESLPPIPALRRMSAAELRRLGPLSVPLLKRRGDPRFRRLSWEDAAKLAGTRLKAAQGARWALLVGEEDLGNETFYQLQKFARLLGTPHIDRVGDPGAEVVSRALLHRTGTTNSCGLRELLEADLVLLWGVGLHRHPALVRHLLLARERGARLLSINPVREPLLQAHWQPHRPLSLLWGSRVISEHLPVRPGGDAHLARQLLAALDGAGGGGPGELVEQLAVAKRIVLVPGAALGRGPEGPDAAAAVAELLARLELSSRDGCGVLPLLASPGLRGARDCGLAPDSFPGPAAPSPARLSLLRKRWGGLHIPGGPGLSATQIKGAALSGELAVLYCAGGALDALIARDPSARAALSQVPNHIHQERWLRPAMLLDPGEAVLVLPARGPHEHRGGLTHSAADGVVRFSPEVRGHGRTGALEGWRIPLRIAEAIAPGLFELLDVADAVSLRREIEADVPGYAGLAGLLRSGDLLRSPPYRGLPPASTELLAPPPEEPPPPGCFLLSTRRGGAGELRPRALREAGRAAIRLCDRDREALGLRDGDSLVLRSEHGELLGTLVVTEIERGVVQVPWPEAAILLDYRGAVTEPTALDGRPLRVRIEPA